MQFLHGEALSDRDVTGVLLNAAAARMLWDRTEVVGEPLPRGALTGARVIGVVSDVSYGHPLAAPEPAIYRIGAAMPESFIVVRTALRPSQLETLIEREIQSGTIELDLVAVREMQAVANELLAPDRTRMSLAMTAASLVVLLTAFGIYGIQRYLVNAGRREFAVRAALGAGTRTLGHLVMARGLMIGLPGLVIGGLLAYIVTTWLREDIISTDVPPGGVSLIVVVAISLLVLLASWGPARQVRRSAPAPLLREE